MPTFSDNVRVEFSGSPRLEVRSRGNGTQHYSIRATNNADPDLVVPNGQTAGRRLVIRNEDAQKDLVVIEPDGTVVITEDIRLAGADCAEEFDVADVGGIERGTVVVIGEGDGLEPCTAAYDRRVAGIISGAGNLRTAITLNSSHQSPTGLPLALNGRAFCWVDAAHGPVVIGDLLTTSPTPGHAMRADDVGRSFGAVIGKALGPLQKGRALIPVLVALQ